MSRVGLLKRVDTLRDTLMPPGSLARKLYELSAADQRAHDQWRLRCAQVVQQAIREGGPGAAYQRLINGELALPHIERRAAWLEDYLYPKPDITGDLRHLYNEMLT